LPGLALPGAGACLLAALATRSLTPLPAALIAVAVAVAWAAAGRLCVLGLLDQSSRRAAAADERLAQQAQRSSEFLANTVHELRTPLTTVIASLDMLHEGYASSPAERDEIMEQATAACRHLMMLINDLLDAAAYESGRLNVDMQECDVDELLHDAQHLLRPLAIARGVDLQIVLSEENLRITTDRARILQVLFNLVGNAIKFSPSGSAVLVQVLSTPLGVAFEVVDNGPGIPPQARSRLFTKYERLHGPQAPGGTGIGLYLSKILVEQMHGSIGFMEREPGPGAVFWFTLPLAIAVAAPGAPRA
jgi:signal transduction histidine kinase